MCRKNLAIILACVFYLNSCSSDKFSVLIEAESFSNTGGWVVDPQFVEQMGSPYHLAHGLGKPVADAVTEQSAEIRRRVEQLRFDLAVRDVMPPPPDV